MVSPDFGPLLNFIYKAWIFFRYVFIVLAVAFTIGGVNDFFVDVYYWGRQLYRRLFKRKLIRPLTLEQLRSVEEKPLAMVIPAWHEAGVIRSMLLNTLNTIDYDNYFIFVGCYPNDPDTQAEVDQVAEVYPRVIKVVNSKPGPTTKADNLNEIYRGLCAFEEKTGFKFEIIVLSDSEDIHHPLSFKLFNYLMPRFEMIQIPIIPLENPWHSFVGGVYQDEFAEMHQKELIVREKIARILPSAGTSTAFWRDSLRRLDPDNTGQIFNPKTLTEDYEIGIRLGRLGLRQIILLQWVERLVTKPGKARPKKVKELVATRAFFLTEFRKAVRQRARWVYGIAWQGLKNIGWDRNLKISYTLLRDRLAFFTNFLYFFGYLLIFYLLLVMGIRLFRPDFYVPPLVRHDEIWWKFSLVVLFFLVWRLVMRFIFVGKIYGLGTAALTPIRIVVGNVLNFASSTLAMLWLIRAISTKREQAWIKTEHKFPAEELAPFHRKIGDLLLSRHLVTAKQLEQAVKIQQKSRPRKKLGQVLLELGYITEEDLAAALATQRKWAFVEIDPFAVEPQVLRMVPKWMAERYRIFPLKYEDEKGVLHLAIDRIDLGLLQSSLEEFLGVKISFKLTTPYDINYAIEKAYSEEYERVRVGRRLGEMLVSDGILTGEQLQAALRRQKRTGESLGEILLDEKMIEEQVLDEYLKKQREEAVTMEEGSEKKAGTGDAEKKEMEEAAKEKGESVENGEADQEGKEKVMREDWEKDGKEAVEAEGERTAVRAEKAAEETAGGPAGEVAGERSSSMPDERQGQEQEQELELERKSGNGG